MGIYMAMANLACGAICLILALVFLFNKNAVTMLAGYNTLPTSEKAKYNGEKLRSAICKLLFFGAALMIIAGVLIACNIAATVLLIVSWSVFAVTLIIAAIYVNLSARFKA